MYPSRTLWCTLACGLNVLVVSAAGLSAGTFENTAVVRTVELGGSLTHVTTTYAVRALENNVELYYVSLSDEEEKSTTWIEAKLKGQSTILDVDRHGFNPKKYVLFFASFAH
jgi:oligosaccharyltransferase complex subunit alpha (ribophorin I)